MKIKDELVCNVITWAEEDNIEYNTIGSFQTSYSNTPVYYIVRRKVNTYTLQGEYTCRAFYPPFIIPEGELVCPSKFMTIMRKTSYLYHEPDEAIPIVMKLKQVVIPYIELIQDNNTTNKF